MVSERPRIAAAAAIAAALLLAAHPAAAQEISVDLGGQPLSLRLVQVFALVTLLSLAPGIAVMITCFPFMVTVLSILRQAVGVQQAPPNMMIVSLALFLTWFVMEPVFVEAWDAGLGPLARGEAEPGPALEAGFAPFRAFMQARVDPDTLAEIAAAAPGRLAEEAGQGRLAAELGLLVPAFLLSEIQRGFEVGFLVFLPFLVIDLAVASILMSMGMMMVPPAVVALPFKLAFFVLADGWTLLAGALVRSYSP
ncbi:MAG: flagellar biosynthetic protein FliP [Paracoccaceae bacterium]|nr:MAG: flagellar biosynthetic protein FliP [Alphaproteobacteria bacterium]GIX15503.1 MAG: flagellar biosynthetic protein FliP [Paracoccaceae bacterium]